MCARRECLLQCAMTTVLATSYSVRDSYCDSASVRWLVCSCGDSVPAGTLYVEDVLKAIADTDARVACRGANDVQF